MSIFPKHLPILMYHQILPSSNPYFKNHIAVEPENFRSQLKLLQAEGWKFVTLKEYFAAEGNYEGQKVAVLTFDDISSAFIEYAVPVLNEFKAKASVFPIQNMTAGSTYHNLNPNGIRALTEDEIRSLDQQGFEIGSHCQTHQNLRKISFKEAQKELKESKDWLEKILGKKVHTICFPIGGIDRDLVQYSQEIGYDIGVSTLKGALQLKRDRMSLRRVNIKNNVLGDKLLSSVGPLYGIKSYLSRPFRAKYRGSERHPDFA